MNRRFLLALAALLPLAARAQPAPTAPALTPQDNADLRRVEAYLNGVKTLHARFQQIAPNGSITNGEAWLERPGRMRFQYDPPAPFLLVAGHGLLVFQDKQLGQVSNIPLERTPLGLLLQDNLRLQGAVTVSRVARLPNQLQVTLFRTATPGEGSLTLIFADNPLALRSWTVVDAQRLETRVILANVTLGGTFDQSLFTLVDPRFFQNNSN